MQIIKKLIIRNKLKKELQRVDDFLNDNGYYALDMKLYYLRCQPEEYADLYYKIENAFRPTLNRKHELEKQIQSLSGKNLFVKMDLEEFSK